MSTYSTNLCNIHPDLTSQQRCYKCSREMCRKCVRNNSTFCPKCRGENVILKEKNAFKKELIIIFSAGIILSVIFSIFSFFTTIEIHPFWNNLTFFLLGISFLSTFFWYQDSDFIDEFSGIPVIDNKFKTRIAIIISITGISIFYFLYKLFVFIKTYRFKK